MALNHVGAFPFANLEMATLTSVGTQDVLAVPATLPSGRTVPALKQELFHTAGECDDGHCASNRICLQVRVTNGVPKTTKTISM